MKQLKFLFYGSIAVALAIVVVFETGLLTEGSLAYETVMSYRFEYVMEILSIALVYLAVKLFAIKKIKAKLVEGGEKALLHWGTLRILMLGIPLILNTVLYYLFLAVAFGYLAIIILISMAFIVPTKERCKDDITAD